MHVGIIMDGNGRWAVKKGLPRTQGHTKGMERLTEIILYCSRKDNIINYLTMYAFSVQNWGRQIKEINCILWLIEYILRDTKIFEEANIKIRVEGYINIYPKKILDLLKNIENKTKNNTGLFLTINLSYGGREEIVDAVNEIISLGITSTTQVELSTHIEKAGIPDPDLIIRTGGEYRVSNFLLWQSAYAEYVFLDLMWPDFTTMELDKALDIYSKRTRRFGLVKNIKEDEKYIIPDENKYRIYIEKILNSKFLKPVLIEKYTDDSFLSTKYFTIINDILLENTKENPLKTTETLKLTHKLFPNKPDHFYKRIQVWGEFIFLIDSIINSNGIQNSIGLKQINTKEINIVDIHKLFGKYIDSDETNDQFKRNLFDLGPQDISLYKHIVQNYIKCDKISAIMSCFYSILPIFDGFLNTKVVCLIASIIVIFNEDNVKTNQESIFESILGEFEKESLFCSNCPITIKESLRYLILFYLKHNDKNKITLNILFQYLQIIL